MTKVPSAWRRCSQDRVITISTVLLFLSLLTLAIFSFTGSVSAQTWTFCAQEDQTCSFSGVTLVRYGANTSYVYQTATNSIACNNATFGDPLYGAFKHCDYATSSPALSPIPISAPTPTPFDFSLSNGGNNSVNAGSSVTNNITASLASGSSQQIYFSIAGLPTGATASFSQSSCNPDCLSVITVKTTAATSEGNFPITVTATGGGVSRTTTFMLAVVLTVAMPAISPNGGSVSAQTWTICAVENQFCSFTGTKLVRYGSNTSFNFQTATNGITCNNATFGDPLYGVGKHCDYTDTLNVTRTLTVASSNPNGGTSITISPNDNSNQGNGTTQFTRIYNNNTAVTLIAALTAGGNGFSNWTGCDSTSGTNCNVTMSADKTVTAVYATATAQWTFCANEEQTCSFSGVTLVRYGANASYFYQTATNSIACNNATFGDPLYGAFKHCDYAVSSAAPTPSPFDFSLSNGGNKSVNAGSSVTNNITASLASGSSQQVSFSVSGLPSGTMASLSSGTCNPNCATTLSVSTTSSTQAGNFPITVTATGGGVSKTTTFTLTVLLISAPVTASGKTYYVATNGSDSNSCAQAQSISTPKRHIMGASGGLACLTSGAADILDIRGGSYPEMLLVDRTPNGTSWANAATIRAHSGETVIINPIDPYVGHGHVFQNVEYLIVQDLVFDAANQAGNTIINIYTGTSHIRFLNVEVKNAPSGVLVLSSGNGSNEFIGGSYHDNDPTGLGYHAFYIGSNDNLWDGVKIYNVGAYGIHIFGYVFNTEGHPTRNVVRNSEIYNSCRAGNRSSWAAILLGPGTNYAYNNLLHDNKCYGIEAGYGENGGQILNNTITGNLSAGIHLNNVSNMEIKNNIIYGNKLGALALDNNSSTVSGTIYGNNLCGSAGTGCAVVGNPLFVDAANHNYNLQAGSPAIDAGADLSPSIPSTDYIGTPRPLGSGWDIGAYESR